MILRPGHCAHVGRQGGRGNCCIVLGLGGVSCPSLVHEDTLANVFLYIPDIKKKLGGKLETAAISLN